MASEEKRAGVGDSTYLDTELRVRRAEELLCEVRTSKEMVETLVAEFNVVERTAYTYIKLAYDRLSADTEYDRGIRKAQARATWRAQYRKCLAGKQFQAANYALDRLCRLDGLFAPEKLEISASLSVDMQIHSIVGVLDEKGMAALAIVAEQVEAARVKGLLPNVANDPDEQIEKLHADPVVPIPAKARGRKADRSGTRKRRNAED